MIKIKNQSSLTHVMYVLLFNLIRDVKEEIYSQFMNEIYVVLLD